jgi:hypothetical protein
MVSRNLKDIVFRDGVDPHQGRAVPYNLVGKSCEQDSVSL